MQWEREAWRQLYLREEGSFAALPLYARSLAAEIIKFCDEDGRISLGGMEPWQAIAKVARAEPNERRVVKKHVQILLDDGYLVADGSYVRVRNLRAAQVGTLSSHGPATQVASERHGSMHPLCIHSASTLHPVDIQPEFREPHCATADPSTPGMVDALTRASDPDQRERSEREERSESLTFCDLEPGPVEPTTDGPAHDPHDAPLTSRSPRTVAQAHPPAAPAVPLGQVDLLAVDVAPKAARRRRSVAKPRDPVAPKPPSRNANYRAAYEAGIRAGGNGVPFLVSGSPWSLLGAAMAHHATGPDGALKGDALDAWIRSSAEQFRRATADRGEVWGGWSVPSFIRWLNCGRPVTQASRARTTFNDSSQKFGVSEAEALRRSADRVAMRMAEKVPTGETRAEMNERHRLNGQSDEEAWVAWG